MNTQLLITFTKTNKLNNTIDEIKSCYALAFNKVYVLENTTNTKELICSYNIDVTQSINASLIPLNPISVHRKKETNSIYTINALNYIVSLLNDGVVDSTFPIPWENYKNQILVTNTEGIKKIHTKMFKIIDVEK